MTGQSHHIYWQSLEEPGFEHLHIVCGDSGIEATGFILRKLGDLHLRNRYEMVLSADWQFRSLSLGSSESGGEAKPRRLQLSRDDAGNWSREGQTLPELAGCCDVDIQITPFTNSLPIGRLKLAPGESAEVDMVYLPFPALMPQRHRQRYRCLAADRYLFEAPDSGFSAELPLDRHGLVLDYPTLFQRSWPR
ncbi:MAG TPA: putative glycolipid-binding domain-containing protein [Kiloniellaceae bacterium]|nr:putative glycolipid-binding domain-containing protein [Kiloniellaceae bacterium]